MTDRLRTTNDLAILFKCHPETIHRHRRKGMLSYVLVGRRPLFRDEDVEAYLKANLVPARREQNKA